MGRAVRRGRDWEGLGRTGRVEKPTDEGRGGLLGEGGTGRDREGLGGSRSRLTRHGEGC